MELQEIKVSDVLILQPEGHMDTAAAVPTEERVLKLIENGERKVLMDCSKLQYVNSSGLKVFLVAAKRLDALGGKLVVCDLAPNVQMVFQMIGFTKILSIYPSRAEALESFGQKGSTV
jgi:anti-anti-sigma factor